MILDIDFHIHSKYSGGTSGEMVLPMIAKQAELKGLGIVGTGDALHPGWLSHIKENLTGNGVYSIEGLKTGGQDNLKTCFIITAEVEDAQRVHHIILFPSIESAEGLYDVFRKYSVDIDRDGRPHLGLNAKEVVDYCTGVDAMAGPAHAFTPWTSLYKQYGSIAECYGDNLKRIKFLELGLSADTNMADRVEELQGLTFLTNSDCHSPWPHRLGREFNRVECRDATFDSIKKAIENHDFKLNAGLNPQEGKYHMTACTRCFKQYPFDAAVSMKMRCGCRGLIKKGVADRINELAAWDKPHHPAHRPAYMHILPLAEVISFAFGMNVMTKGVQAKWNELVSRFGTEINVLVDSDIGELKKADKKIGAIIEMFRTGKLQYSPGGGGQYGRPVLSQAAKAPKGQAALSDF